MRVTVDVKGEGTSEVDLDELAAEAAIDGRPTYADLLSRVDYSPHEVSVLVDGRPVPEDRPVDASAITVLRLITGG